MGDRGNIYVHEGDLPGVYLYTHWTGSNLNQIVAEGLRAGRGRWDDTPYLTRILFDTLSKGQQGGTTGYGISAQLGDGGDKVVDVDTQAQRVRWLNAAVTELIHLAFGILAVES